MKKLFFHKDLKPITADEMYTLFMPNFALEGSNEREQEEQAMIFWVQYLQLIKNNDLTI